MPRRPDITGPDPSRRRRAPLVAPGRPPGPPAAPSFPPPPPTPPGLKDDDGRWMSPREAAAAAGVPLATVGTWRKAGTIAERKLPGKGVQVFLTPDHAAPGDDGAGEPPRSELGVLVPLEVYQRSLAELILRLTDTTERAVRAEAELELLRRQLGDGPLST